MWRLTFWTYFLLVALSLAPVQRVFACTCMKSHPQSLYCKSDYVAVVRVRSVEPKNMQLAYHVKVNKVFKDRNSVNPVNFPRREILWTVVTDSMCGVVLNVGETYVISGMIGQGRIHISLCGLHMRWFEVPPRQRKGFRGLFHRGCACDENEIYQYAMFRENLRLHDCVFSWFTIHPGGVRASIWISAEGNDAYGKANQVLSIAKKHMASAWHPQVDAPGLRQYRTTTASRSTNRNANSRGCWNLNKAACSHDNALGSTDRTDTDHAGGKRETCTLPRMMHTLRRTCCQVDWMYLFIPDVALVR